MHWLPQLFGLIVSVILSDAFGSPPHFSALSTTILLLCSSVVRVASRALSVMEPEAKLSGTFCNGGGWG